MDRSIPWRPDVPRWQVRMFYAFLIETIVSVATIPFGSWVSLLTAFVGIGVITSIKMHDIVVRRSRM